MVKLTCTTCLDESGKEHDCANLGAAMQGLANAMLKIKLGTNAVPSFN